MNTLLIKGKCGDRKTKAAIVIGETYRLKPANPKFPDQDRLCEVLAFDDIFYKYSCIVRFCDNGRTGRVARRNLVPVDCE